MTLNWLQSLFYGLICGFAEFLPVSSEAQGILFARLFGVADAGYLFRAFVHIGALLAVFIACRPQVSRILRERRIAAQPLRKRKRQPDVASLMDLRFLKTAAIPMLLGFIAYPWLKDQGQRLWILGLMLIANGFILYTPQFLPGANKDARTLSRLDSVLIGFGGAFAVIPGISRIAAITSVASVRGTDRQYALQSALLLCIPALIVMSLMELVFLMIGGTAVTAGMLLGAVLAGLSAMLGGYLSVMFVQFLSVKAGFTWLGYYCWGAALFAFILYLMT